MRIHEGDPRRVATILPGRRYTPDMPLLYFTRRVLLDDGWTVRDHRWGDDPDPAATIHDAARVIDHAGRPEQHVVVGMGFGTLGAPAVVDRGLPAVWLAPLLRDDTVRAAVAATLEPTLLVGGTDDAAWDGPFAAGTRCEVHEVRHADRALEIPGSVRSSIKTLERVVHRVQDFVAGLGG